MLFSTIKQRNIRYTTLHSTVLQILRTIRLPENFLNFLILIILQNASITVLTTTITTVMTEHRAF